MAFSLNKIQLIGNIGQDAETRFTTNNLEVTTFSIATVNSYKGKDGNWCEDTTWHNVVGFKLSDFIKDNLKKGRKFYVEGRLQKRDYTNKDGVKIYVTEVIIEKAFPLDRQASSNESVSTGYSEPVDSSSEDDDLPF